MKRKQPLDPIIHRKLPIGTRCLIGRPSLWFGCEAIVEKVSPEGIHRMLVQGNAPFHADVEGSALKEVE